MNKPSKAEAVSGRGRTVTRLVTFAVLGSVMFVLKTAMAVLPNIHPLALCIAAMTLVYRTRALVPLYVYVMLDGVFTGFTLWWLPYLYIWLPLWAGVMLASKLRLPRKFRVPLYMAVCGLHGLSFGALYAPAQAVMFGLGFKATVAWIAAGIPFDVVHGIGDFVFASAVLPLSAVLRRFDTAR